MKKIIILYTVLLSCSIGSYGQVVETVVTHPKIVDGLYVDGSGNVFTTSGGLVGGVEIGKYDVQLDSYIPDFASGFSGPINIIPYRDSLFVVTNYDNSSVYSYNLNSGVIDTLAINLDGPAGLTVDTIGNIFITNWGQAPGWAGSEIHKISPAGVVNVYIDSSALYRPQAIAMNHEAEIIVHSQQKLYKINPVDSTLSLWVNLGVNVGNMTFRKKDSCIYGASNQGHRIMRINPAGNVSVFAGSVQGYQDGELSSALFTSPLGIAFSPSEDTLYIAEAGMANRLRRILMNQMVNVHSLDSEGNMSVYPNPSDGEYIIDFQKVHDGRLDVFDVHGELIRTYKGLLEKVEIDLSNCPQGNYMLKFKGGRQTLIKQIVKL